MMSEIVFEDDGPEIDPTLGEPALDEPVDNRPDLSEIGLIEHERGVVEDTYENRAALRRAKLNWQPVYDQSGNPTGLIAARSPEAMKERRMLSLHEKRPLLVDPGNPNSDYVTGLDLLVDADACRITPPWVVGATRHWQKEQELGGVPAGSRRAPKALPHRCRMIKSDGIRCMLWSSGRLADDGLCRIHLKVQRKPGEDIERARKKIIQAAPYAVDVLEELMESAVSEPVRLKASTEILDRAGVRGGIEIDANVEVTDARPAHVVVAERLAKLASGAAAIEAVLGGVPGATSQDGAEVEVESSSSPTRNESDSDDEIVDAEVIEVEGEVEDWDA
jgi:hypothetical protein